jgi:hypothetical protein
MAYPSFLPAFMTMSKKFEGYLPWMYVDNHKLADGTPDGLVTTGLGDLIDPVSVALQLPWRHGVGGPLASQSEIIDAFNTVKHSGMNAAGGGNQGHLTDLRLNDDGIQQVVAMKIRDNERTLSSRIRNWDSLPLEVQLVAHSMAWAMGANFNYPKFLGYLNQTVPDFRAAARETYMPDNKEKSLDFPPKLNPGLRPRNIMNQLLLINADNKVRVGAAFDQLIEPIENTLSEAYEGVTSIAQAAAQTAVQVVKKNPLIALSAWTGAGLITAGGVYLYQNRNKL